MPDRPKRVLREQSYEPPFSGSLAQPVTQYRQIHTRWVEKLLRVLPDGVPAEAPIVRCTRCHCTPDIHPKDPHAPTRRYRDGRYVRCGHCRVAVVAHKLASCTLPGTYVDDTPHPATFGDLDEYGRPIHRPDEGAGHCFQCGLCCYYIPLDASIGADWGACTNPRSQYDGRVTFEHSTCRYFSYDGLEHDRAAAAQEDA